jgi:hypothetical protein
MCDLAEAMLAGAAWSSAAGPVAAGAVGHRQAIEGQGLVGVSQTCVMLAGRYQLEARVACGSVGQVWSATDLVLGRAVAVKLLRPEYSGHAETLARFRAEARHAGAVSHPGIAQVYDYGDSERASSPYLVMELVDGPSLAGVLAGGPLGAARTMDVVAQAAAGLAAAHAAGLVHRDIKPANLLLGRGGQVKITDFGIAHAAGSAPLTVTGTLVGTPAYLAPERAAGASATAASDLYSLGVVAYECLAGAPPFTGSALEVASAHRHQPLPPLPAAVPAGVAALVGELTAKDPAARPASAGEVAVRAGRLKAALAGGHTSQVGPGRDLPTATLAAGQPVTLAEVPVAGPAGPRPRRPLWAWPGRGVVLALAVTAAVAGLAGWLLATVSGPPPPPQRVAAPRARATAAAAPAPHPIEVNRGVLAGLPVSVARQRLRLLGLASRVIWVPTAHQQPGTVISLHPTGQVMTGSTVTVSAATRPHPRQGNGQGNNNGD